MPKTSKVKNAEYKEAGQVDETESRATNEEPTTPEEPAVQTDQDAEPIQLDAEPAEQEADKPVETEAPDNSDAEQYGEPEPEQPQEQEAQWSLSDPAPYTVYQDTETGELTRNAPTRSTVVVWEGGQVTPSILRTLGKEF